MRRLAAISFLLLGSLLPAQKSRPAERPPNLVLIVADDLGWGELGCYGGKLPTPNLDRLASGGVRFTQGYVTCPVCAPTRAGLLTGRYQQRFGFELNPGPIQGASPRFGLPREQRILSERLRDAGFTTAMFGKWHLGYREGLRPIDRGFDEFYGFLAGAHGYAPATTVRSQLLHGSMPAPLPEHLTDELALRAARFIAKHKNGPFFLYLPFNAVHAPMQATPKYLERFASIADPRRRTFAAMLSALDDGAGAVLDALRAAGVEDDTLVFFLSDNGGPTRVTTSGNGPLRGFKGEVFEGGIRVPFLLQWKRRIAPGQVCEQPVTSLDVSATALAAAGISPRGKDALDGVDLLPFLAGERRGQRPHDTLWWRFGQQSAVRVQDYKLVKGPRGATLLFDLKADPGEQNDLAAAQPERVAELQRVYAAWNAQLLAPQWRRQGRQPAPAAPTSQPSLLLRSQPVRPGIDP
jgi:arylsulfatase A-like enzyme